MKKTKQPGVKVVFFRLTKLFPFLTFSGSEMHVHKPWGGGTGENHFSLTRFHPKKKHEHRA